MFRVEFVMTGYDTPEKAAMADYPAAHCHPVTSVVHGNEVEAVRLAFQGETIEVAVTEQVYLFTCWRAPASAQFPHVAQYRVAGQWLAASN